MSKLVSASSNRSQLKACRYDVFLSFRGANTRKSFTGHLLEALKRNGYYTFHDSKLPRGEYIDSELLKAIEESRMSIIVFSNNYADSKWCLDELVKIMYCRNYCQQIVLPVFLDVEPSDVRNQEGVFSKAFAHHEEHMDGERVENWRKALKETGKLSGLHLQNDTNGYEAKLVDKIIKEVAKHLKRPCLNVAYYPVGIESRMAELMQLLDMETDDVRIVAIWGVGGLGKTTIAKATYNCIFSEFESSSFLEDIKDSEKNTLQNKLIGDLMTDKTPRVNNVYRGTEEIKRILMFQRVLLVLDDIDNFEQLEMLAIDRRFFCPGSRVIITTRDRASVGSLRVDAVYSPGVLNEYESLKLFSLYAFGEDHPHKGYEVVAKEVVYYARGIPLVLKTLGSSSSNLSKPEWQDYLKKLKKVPNDDVQGILKVSFDSLGYEDKELFLNISCFFIGMDKYLMVKAMEDSNCFPTSGLKTLVNRALVNIDGGVLSMHNLIRDMGREIVRQESLKEPGARSRLWDHDDIAEVFRRCSGTAAVESILHGNYNNFRPLESVNIEVFRKMPNLKMLLLHHVGLYGTYNQMHSFENLRYLQWHGFPVECMPSSLNMRNLVVMDMQSSRLKLLWEGTMVWPIIPEIKVSLPGTEIPEWCTYQGSGQFLSFVVPKDMDKKFSGWIYCAIAPDCKYDECRLKCKVVNKTKGRADYIGTTVCGYGPMFLAFVPHLIDLIPRLTFMVEGGDEMVLGFELDCENNWEVQKCGLCLIYEGDESVLALNVEKEIEYTPSDLHEHLHQLVFEEKWEEFREIYLMYVNSNDDDDDDGEAGGGDHVDGDGDGDAGAKDDDVTHDDDVIEEDDGGGGDGDDQLPHSEPTEGGPWFQLRPEELGDWLHHPLASQTQWHGQ